jgi:hypothetical protein
MRGGPERSNVGSNTGEGVVAMRSWGSRDAMLVSLVVIGSFNALSALAGGVGILLTDGLGMPAAMLTGSPFTSFLWPGIVLLVVVGGTQAVAVVLILARRATALAGSAVAGFGMVIWIFVETGIIRGFSWLQVLYFTTGILQIALVIALSGAVAWLPAAPTSGLTTSRRSTSGRPEYASSREPRA